MFFKILSRSHIKKVILKYEKIFAVNYVTETRMSLNDMPHPKSLPILGTKVKFLYENGPTKLHEYVDKRHKELGPIFYEILEGTTKLVFISDPKLMKALFLGLEGKYPDHILPEPWTFYEKLHGSKRGLFFMGGEAWWDHRRILNKYLLREDSDKWIEEPIKRTIEMFINDWKVKAEAEKFVPDLETDFYRLSTNIIIAILLGNNASLLESNHYNELINIFSDSVKNIFQYTTKLYGLPLTLCHRLKLEIWTNFEESVHEALKLAKKIVNEILNNVEKTNGLVHLLGKENMTDEMITRIVADFIIAAGDTTVNTLLWTIYLISNNKDEMENIRNKDSAYLTAVIKESMRLYPVAPFLTRILTKQITLGKYELNQGTPIIASIYTSGRDDNNFSQAKNFLPYRWDRQDPRRRSLANHEPSASLPFAMGARSCIGKKIAMIELTEAIKQIVVNFDLQCENSEKINAVTSQVLVPDKELKILFKPRKKE